jgi:hypothetical protein
MGTFAYATVLKSGLIVRVGINSTGQTVVNPEGFTIAVGGTYTSFQGTVGVAPLRNSDGGYDVSLSPSGDSVNIVLENPIIKGEVVSVAYEPGNSSGNTLDAFGWTVAENESEVVGESWTNTGSNSGVVLESEVGVILGVVSGDRCVIEASGDGWLMDGHALVSKATDDTAIKSLRATVQSNGPTTRWIIRNISAGKLTIGKWFHRALHPGEQVEVEGPADTIDKDMSLRGARSRKLIELIAR